MLSSSPRIVNAATNATSSRLPESNASIRLCCAGADVVLTYWAAEACGWLDGE
jgi:delta-aminolevulinic acid dehydratase/porphobilinogen synthase